MSLFEKLPGPRSISAFTLLELLMVIGIITLLLALLLPTFAEVREKARATECASNVRSLCLGLIAYSSENRWHFPPNVSLPSPGQYWFDDEHVGGSLGVNVYDVHSSVFTCPDDQNASLSYAMNIWASCTVDAFVLVSDPSRNRFWCANVQHASQILLVTESWSAWGSNASGWLSSPSLGFDGDTPGHRFGANGGISPPIFDGRWGIVNCEIDYMRHRDRADAAVGTQPKGSVNIGYADGHVVLVRNGQLADYSSGTLTGNCYWSPIEVP